MLLLVGSLQGSEEYVEYCNERFGFCVHRPYALGIEPPPLNNDGRSFYNNEGFLLRVYGGYNALQESFAGHIRNLKGEFDTVTYEQNKHNWAVLSGHKGDKILYIKVIFEDETFYTLWIEYPTNDKNLYSSDTSVISKSFRVVR